MFLKEIRLLQRLGYIYPEGPQRSCLDRMDPIPSSWESGGGISGKADLPELPSSASPLQFGDWIHLCGRVMRDLSSIASRWWDLTVRQVQSGNRQLHFNGLKSIRRFLMSSKIGAMVEQSKGVST